MTQPPIVLVGYDPRRGATHRSPFDTYQGTRLAQVAGLNADRDNLLAAFDCRNLLTESLGSSFGEALARETLARIRGRRIIAVGNHAAELAGLTPHPWMTWRSHPAFVAVAVIPSPSKVNRAWSSYSTDVGVFLARALLTPVVTSVTTGVTGVTDVTGDDEVLDYAGAAELLNLEQVHLRQLVRRRQIPHIRLTPRTVRFSKVSLLLWMERRTVNPGEPAP